MTEITDLDRERAQKLAIAIFGGELPPEGNEFLAICQALADAREGVSEPSVVVDDSPPLHQ